MKKPVTKTKLPLDEFIVKHFETGLRRWEKKSNAAHAERGEKAWNIFRVSEIGECQAALTRDWIGQAEERDCQSLLRLHDGTMAHEEIREIFKLSDLELLHEEREVRKEYVVPLEKVVKVPVTLIGHQDNGFAYNGEEVVVDFKKASEYSYDKMEQGDLSDAYWDQLQGYLDILGLRYGVLFVKGVHGKVTAVLVERDEEYFKTEVLPRLARTALFRKKRDIGRRDFHFGLPPCTYCRHEGVCWTVEASEAGTDEVLVPRNHPQFVQIRTAHEVHARSKDLEEKAAALKSDARAAAISLLRKFKAKRIKSSGGNISWTSFAKKTVKLKEEKKLEAVKKGFAIETTSSVEYPLFSKGQTE